METSSKYPTSSQHGRDWNKLEQEVKEEEKNEKLEGDAALNKLFQQIYSDGTDEVKKAMMKSFVSPPLFVCKVVSDLLQILMQTNRKSVCVCPIRRRRPFFYMTLTLQTFYKA